MSLLREYLSQTEEIKKTDSLFQIMVKNNIKENKKSIPRLVFKASEYKESFISAMADRDFFLADSILIKYKEERSNAKIGKDSDDVILNFIRDVNTGRPYIVDAIAKYADYDFVKSLSKYGFDINKEVVSKHSDNWIHLISVAAHEKNYSLVLDAVKSLDLKKESKISICSDLLDCFFVLKKAKDVGFYEMYKRVEPYLLSTPIFSNKNLGVDNDVKDLLNPSFKRYDYHATCGILNNLSSVKNLDENSLEALKRIKKILNFFNRDHFAQLGLINGSIYNIEKVLILNELGFLDLSKDKRISVYSGAENIEMVSNFKLGRVEELNIWLYLWNQREYVLHDLLKIPSCKNIIRELYEEIKVMKDIKEKLPLLDEDAFHGEDDEYFNRSICYSNNALLVTDFKNDADYEKLIFGVSDKMSSDKVMDRILLIKSVFEGYLPNEELYDKYKKIVHEYLSSNASQYGRKEFIKMLTSKQKRIAISVDIMQFVDIGDEGFYAEIEKKLLEGVGKTNKKIAIDKKRL